MVVQLDKQVNPIPEEGETKEGEVSEIDRLKNIIEK